MWIRKCPPGVRSCFKAKGENQSIKVMKANKDKGCSTKIVSFSNLMPTHASLKFTLLAGHFLTANSSSLFCADEGEVTKYILDKKNVWPRMKY